MDENNKLVWVSANNSEHQPYECTVLKVEQRSGSSTPANAHEFKAYPRRDERYDVEVFVRFEKYSQLVKLAQNTRYEVVEALRRHFGSGNVIAYSSSGGIDRIFDWVLSQEDFKALVANPSAYLERPKENNNE